MHLEFGKQASCPWTSQDKDALEKVQKRAVGMVSGWEGSTFEEKLKELGLTMHQADMLQVYEIP